MLEDDNKENQLKINEMEEKLKAMSKPFWFSQMLAKYTCLIVVIVNITALMLGFIIFQFNLLTLAENTKRDFYIQDDEKVVRDDMFSLMKSEFDESKKGNLANIPLRSELNSNWLTFIMYESSNIFTVDSLNKIKKIENKFKNFQNKYDKFCLAHSSTNSSCAKENSILNFFSNTSSEKDIQSDIKLNSNNFYYKILLQNSFSSTNLNSKIARSIYNFGAPINIDNKNYTVSKDDLKEQNKIFSNFIYDFFLESEKFDITTYVFNVNIVNKIVDKVIKSDFMWAFGSFIFVFFYMLFHTKSIMLTILSMWEIILAFPIALFIYLVVFRIKYFANIHIVIIFLILGIAADDFFIFLNTWEQSEAIPMFENDLVARISYVYRKASKAMLVTTITTIFAFLATGISGALPISTFGFFAATLIGMNYLLVISYYPACVILREKFCKKKKIHFLNNQNNNNNNLPISKNEIENPETLEIPEEGFVTVNNHILNTNTNKIDTDKSVIENHNYDTQVFIFKKYFPLI